MKPAVLVTPMASNIPRIPDALYIGVDAGALKLLEAGIEPAYIVGDFDSMEPERLKELENRPGFCRHPVMKDATDTELALELAAACSPKIVMGAFGGRLDHSLANLSLLIFQDPDLILCGDSQFACLYEKGEHEIVRVYRHISFFPLEKSRISLHGLLYELEDREVEPGNTLLVSNSFVSRKKPVIRVHEGRILCIQSGHR